MHIYAIKACTDYVRTDETGREKEMCMQVKAIFLKVDTHLILENSQLRNNKNPNKKKIKKNGSNIRLRDDQSYGLG